MVTCMEVSRSAWLTEFVAHMQADLKFCIKKQRPIEITDLYAA